MTDKIEVTQADIDMEAEFYRDWCGEERLSLREMFARHRTAAQPEREAVEEANSRYHDDTPEGITKRALHYADTPLDPLAYEIERILFRRVIQKRLDGYLQEAAVELADAARIVTAALTTPAPAAESDWFAGDVDCDGNELVTIRADELQKLRDEREKFMWQVRDTCARAEKAEAALAATPAVSTDALCEDCPPVGYPTDKTRCAPCPRRVSTDEIVAVRAADLALARCLDLLGHIRDRGFYPPQGDAEALAELNDHIESGDRARAILSRIQGEGE